MGNVLRTIFIVLVSVCVLTGLNAQTADSEIFEAVKALDIERFQQIRNKIADYNMRDKNGDTLAIALVLAYQKRLSSVSGDSALHYASANNDYELAEKLIQAGASPWQRNSSGLSAIDIAEKNKNERILALFSRYSDKGEDTFIQILSAVLDSGADVNATGAGKKSLLYHVTLSGNLKAVRAVLAKKPRIDYRPSDFEETALIAAARRGYRDIAFELITHGANAMLVAKAREITQTQDTGFLTPEDFNAKIVVFSPSVKSERRCYYRVMINNQEIGRTEIGPESQHKSFNTYLPPNTYLLSLEKFVLDERKNSYVKVNNIDQIRPASHYFDTRSDRIIIVTVRHETAGESTYFSEFAR